VVLGYFTFAKLFDTNVRGFIAGTGPFAATAQEAAGKLQIACLPTSVIRTQVLGLLEKRGSPVKLWEPESAGLGKIWAAQGWVLWRWFLPSDATPAADLDIKWLDVPIEGQEGFFSLAAAIAKAAATAAREIK
jgi:hypothetical protein